MEQKTAEWYVQREGRITGSRIASVLGINPWRTADDLIREMVREHHGAAPEFTGNVATEHGNLHEGEAILAFTRASGLTVESCGFFEYGDIMGASPDGLTSDGGVLEVKCPYSLRNGGVFKPLEEQPHYHAQMQLEMAATDRKHGYFVQYIPGGRTISIERIEYDDQFLKRHEPVLRDFHERYMSEIGNPAHLQPLRAALDSEEAKVLLDRIDELRIRQKEDAEYEKVLLGRLVELAGGVDSEIHGRKLTLVKKDGAISYAKAVKELLPDADLERWRGKSSEYWRLT